MRGAPAFPCKRLMPQCSQPRPLRGNGMRLLCHKANNKQKHHFEGKRHSCHYMHVDGGDAGCLQNASRGSP
jgi:hypothetical protein